ncbi:MAG: hypothetical protein ACRDP6_38655 [Actinoallomurus sp.]
MDPVTLIIGALGAGVAPGLTDAAREAVKDAYFSLRDHVKRLVAGRPVAETALDQHASNPDAWRDVLTAELQSAGAGDDEQIIEAAKGVLAIADPEGARVGKYVVDIRGAQGTQVGDHNTQTNTFNSPPQE